MVIIGRITYIIYVKNSCADFLNICSHCSFLFFRKMQFIIVEEENIFLSFFKNTSRVKYVVPPFNKTK